MHIPRLKHLAEVARSIPDEKFKMYHWGKIRTDDYVSLRDLPEVAVPLECHTACCLLGWAAFDPQFNAEGLVWQKEELSKRELDHTTTLMPLDYYRIVLAGDPIGYYHYMEAGQVFFDLTRDQARALFDSGYDMTGEQKAAQIEEMINAHS